VAGKKITIQFLGDSKDLQKAIGDVEGKSGKLTSVLGKVGKAAAIGLGAGLVIAGKGLYDATQRAADLTETMSKTNAIFGGKQAKVLEEWADGAAQSMGQSKQTALDAAATFGTFGKAAGKSGADLSKFSMQNTKLASDLASFHNTSPEQAIEAIGAAFRGEAEPMRAYGVLLDDASMRQQAMKMGLIETTKEALTPQQKVLAAQALMMKQTADAQGDFEKTSGSLANQQKILKAELTNTSAEIGAKLLPAATAVATFLNDKALPAFKEFGGWLSEHFPPVFEKIQTVIAAVMGSVNSDVSGNLSAVRGVFENVTSIVMSLWNAFGSTLVNFAVKSFENIRQVIGGAFKIIQGIFQTVAALLKGDWSGAWEGIKKILSGALEVIKGTVKQALNILVSLFQIGWTAIKGVVTTAWDGIKGATSAAWNAIKGAVSTGIGNVVGAINGLASIPGKVAGFFDQARDGAVQKLQALVSWVAGLPGKILSGLGNLNTLLYNAGSTIIQGLIDGIAAKVGALKDKLTSVTKLIPNWKGPLDKDKILLKPAGEALIEGLIAGIEKKKSKLETVLTKITDHIKKKQDALASLLDNRRSIADSFRGFATSVFGADMGDEENPATAQSLVDHSGGQRARAEQLGADVKALIDKGLSQDLINQLIASGQSGMDQIHLLAGATAEQIAAVNANNAATQAALQAAGLAAADAVMGEQIAQAERDVALADGIRDKLKELLEHQDKNTVVQLIIDGKVLHASLMKLKKSKNQKLELD